MQVFQEQQSDQGCPNLNAQSILTGPDEGLDLQMLLECFEKDLYLPSVLVNIGDRGGTKGEMVGQQGDDAIVCFVPDNNPPE